MIETPHLRRDEYGIEVRNLKPRGWHGLTGEPVRHTEKAIQVAYYSWLLWLPKSRCLRIDGDLYCPSTVINEAKDHGSAEKT